LLRINFAAKNWSNFLYFLIYENQAAILFNCALLKRQDPWNWLAVRLAAPDRTVPGAFCGRNTFFYFKNSTFFLRLYRLTSIGETHACISPE
jgi:hypothetical protein